ncbi:hypothetical protein A0H81_14173 [Grifola frondosa]|uniref:Uncharacterized protein n=1 Tax=Grifola frondosa TaxID=5627 RepID=A0A1C7LMA4_GRIFR|nr:hypothetical protein A0H81_14173 [Grifola frondosa]
MPVTTSSVIGLAPADATMVLERGDMEESMQRWIHEVHPVWMNLGDTEGRSFPNIITLRLRAESLQWSRRNLVRVGNWDAELMRIRQMIQFRGNGMSTDSVEFMVRQNPALTEQLVDWHGINEVWREYEDDLDHWNILPNRDRSPDAE